MKGFEENEISAKAQGGTEIAKRKLAEILDQDLLEQCQIICSRERNLDESKIRIFWCHDMPEDPESAKFRDTDWRDKFHKFVFISNWQFQRYQGMHGIPMDSKCIILESGIEPAPETCLEKSYDDKIRLVYTSTPQRGLEILVPVFEFLNENQDDIHLDVFSSFKIYGWDDYDKQFEPLYDQIRNNPNMTYHGFVPNTELKEYLNKAHIFAYPSIWPETSCRAMLEAMSAGLVCVHPNLGALPETSGALNVMYQFDMDKNMHGSIFAGNLNAAIELVRQKKQDNMIRFNKTYVDSRYNIDFIKSKWDFMLRDLVKKYPDAESRKFPEAMFTYKTS
jgi:UDP-glucose:(glucosyl)LPS alpha-1,2-glucosyltransferase